MKFSSILALAASKSAMPRYTPKQSGFGVVARSNSTVTTKTEDNSTKTVTEKSSTKASPRHLVAKDEVKEGLDETYQECLLAVLDDINNRQQPEASNNLKKTKGLQKPDKLKEAGDFGSEEDNPAGNKVEEAPKHCGCSKSYDDPKPSDCTCPGNCQCQPVEERPECLKEGQKPDYCDASAVDDSGPGDECDPEEEEHEEPEETCDEPVKCEQPEKPCKEHSGDAERVEALPETKQCQQPQECDKPTACKLTPACENYAKQGDCLFCDTNKNSIQDAGETCLPKAHPRPCEEDEDSESENECSLEDNDKREENTKTPFNPFREAPLDHAFAPKKWPSFQPPANFELSKDFEAPPEFFQPQGPCHGLDSDSYGDFLIKDLMKDQL